MVVSKNVPRLLCNAIGVNNKTITRFYLRIKSFAPYLMNYYFIMGTFQDIDLLYAIQYYFFSLKFKI